MSPSRARLAIASMMAYFGLTCQRRDMLAIDVHAFIGQNRAARFRDRYGVISIPQARCSPRHDTILLFRRRPGRTASAHDVTASTVFLVALRHQPERRGRRSLMPAGRYAFRMPARPPKSLPSRRSDYLPRRHEVSACRRAYSPCRRSAGSFRDAVGYEVPLGDITFSGRVIYS